MLCLQLFAHGKCDSGLIEHLVGRIGHVHFVAHPEQKQSALGLVESHLANDLVEALAEQLVAHGAETRLASLALEQLLIEHFTQPGDVDSCGGLVAHVLDEVLALLDPLSRRQDRVEDIFSANRSIFHGGQRCFLHACIQIAITEFSSVKSSFKAIDYLLPKDFRCGFIWFRSMPAATSMGLS